MKHLLASSLMFLAFVCTSQENLNNPALERMVLEYMEEHQIPGLTLALVQNDSITHLQAAGLASIQQESKVSMQSTFELASLTKQFTATAILLLQQEGKLKVGDHLHQYFPECPDQWKSITIQHLLWHTSGLPGLFPHDQFTEPSFTGYSKMSAETLDLMMQSNTINKSQAIESVISDQLDNPPGTAYNYSDVGYLLLGMVIDEVSGSYRDYMEQLFERCGMKNTYLVEQEKVVLGQVRGYSLKNGSWINIMRTWDYEVPSHFGVCSNVSDMLLWLDLISGNELLNDNALAFLFSKGRLNNGNQIPYACGWEVNDINALRFISHTGVTGCIVVRVPEKNTELVLLTNLGYNGNDWVDPWQLAYVLLDAVGIPTKINESHICADGRKQIKFKARKAKAMVGEYSSVDGIEMSISIEDGTVVFKSGDERYSLSLLEDGDWLVLGYDFEYILHFDREKELVISNYGREFSLISED